VLDQTGNRDLRILGRCKGDKPGVVAVEAGATLGWERYVGSGPVVGVDRFGASAPGAEVAARLGLTEDAVCAAARSVVGS